MKFRKNKQGLEKKRSPNSNAILSESSILSPFSLAKKSSANVLEPIFCGNRWASLPKEPVPSGPSSRVRRLDSRWNLYRILSGILKNVLFKTGQEIVGSFSFIHLHSLSFFSLSISFPQKIADFSRVPCALLARGLAEEKTKGGLTKADLKKNKRGKIVSWTDMQGYCRYTVPPEN